MVHVEAWPACPVLLCVEHLLGLTEPLALEFPSKKQTRDIKVLLPEFLATLANGVFDMFYLNNMLFVFVLCVYVCVF